MKYKRNLSTSSFDIMAMTWKHPWTSLICGPTGCGKTFFVKRFLRYLGEMSDTPFARILFFFGEWQPTYAELGKNIEFHEGIPRLNDFADDPRPKLVIIDDLMSSASNNSVIDLFTKGSHHRNISVIFLTQNLFYKGQRDLSLNSHYIVIFKNPRDRAQIQALARQLYPEDTRFLQEAYFNSTSEPHGYILLDLKQSTPDNLRVRTNIFPDDPHHFVYIPRKISKYTCTRSLVPVVRT